MKFGTLLVAITVLAALLVGGCSSYPERAAAVDPQLAISTLKTTLDAWKAGKKIEALATESPAIIAQDFDWMSGKKLAEYTIKGEGKPEDANLRVDVELSLSENGGQATMKKVAYIVGTSPKLTVFRKAFD